MNRREFCRNAAVVGGSVVLAPLVNACNTAKDLTSESATAIRSTAPRPTATTSQNGEPTATATDVAVKQTPSETATAPAEATEALQISAGPALSQIALIKTDNRAAGVVKAIELLKPASFEGKEVLLKPNFNSADPSPGSTHPDVLRALLGQLTAIGAGRITLADRSGMGDTRRVMEQIGVLDLVGDFNCQTMVFDELETDDWVVYRQPGLHWRDGFPVPRMLLNADAIVQTCNLKTHRYGGHFTLSLKNSIGFVAKTAGNGGYNYMTELHNSPHQRLMIAEANCAYEPDLIVMDGVEAFVRGGPAEGERVKPGVVLAGSDRVALDAVGVAILRLFDTTPEVRAGRIFEQEQIARAAELGLGAAGPEMIEFITADSESTAFAEELRQILLA